MERVDYESLLVQDILNSHERNELDISPWYQRRAVWTRPQKAFLINTIHERKPVPTIYIRHRIDFDSERSIKEVVDGQQRIRCILEYRDGVFAARHPNHDKAVKFGQLTKSERIAFLQTAMSAGFLIDSTDGEVIEIFARINTVAKTLNPQEKRNAKFSGAFKQFALSQAVERLPFWRDNGVFSDNDIARMAEVQFVSDLAMNLLEGLQDFGSKKLDDYYETHEERFTKEAGLKKRFNKVFAQLLALPRGSIKATIFSNPQILLSLICVLDGLPRVASKSKLLDCIQDIDRRVEAVRSEDNPRALTVLAYAAFSSGNLHRIKSRRSRQQSLKRYFS